MARDAAEVLRDALALPVEQRATLLDPLIDSLDRTVDEGAEEAWRDEVARRLAEIDSGAVQLVSSDEGLKRLRSRLEK